MGMEPLPTVVAVLIQVLVLAAVGILLGRLAHRVRVPGLVGALLAGILLGPTFFGQIWPDAHRRLFVGGTEQWSRLQERSGEFEADLKAMAGVTPVAIELAKQQQAAELRRLQEQVGEAQDHHQRGLWYVVAVGAIPLVLLRAGLRGLPRGGGKGFGAALPVVLGAWLLSMIAAAGFGLLLIRSGWLKVPEADRQLWLIGAALGCGAVSLPLSLRDKREAIGSAIAELGALAALGITLLVWVVLVGVGGAAGHRVSSATDLDLGALGDHATGAAIVCLLCLWPLRSALRRWPSPTLPWILVPALMLVGAVFGPGAMWLGALASGLALAGGPRDSKDETGQPLDEACRQALEPFVAAFVGLQLNLLTDFDWLLFLLMLIATGDGKAVGAMAAARWMAGRSWWDSLRVGTCLCAGGTVPLIVAYALLEQRIIDAALFCALVLAVAVTATFAGPMLRMVDGIFSSPGGWDDGRDSP